METKSIQTTGIVAMTVIFLAMTYLSSTTLGMTVDQYIQIVDPIIEDSRSDFIQSYIANITETVNVQNS